MNHKFRYVTNPTQVYVISNSTIMMIVTGKTILVVVVTADLKVSLVLFSPLQIVYTSLAPFPHHLVRYTDLTQYIGLLLLLANGVSSTMMNIVKR